MLSVCHIISGDLWAGAEVMAFNLISSLNRSADVSVCAIVLNPGTLSQALENAGVDVVVVNEAEATFFGVLSKVRGVLRKRRPDIIHAHRYKENIIAFFAGGVISKPRLISTQHGMPETASQSAGLRKNLPAKLNLLLLKHGFHRYVCVSEDLKKRLVKKHALKPGGVGVIHNGIPLRDDAPPENLGHRVTIGSAGRLFPVKDFPMMIDVARELRRMGRSVTFRLAGDGPLKRKLFDRVAALGLEDCFEFAGHVNDMPSFYHSIDIYLNTSVHEGIPMTLLEAMSYGLPVVAPDVGGIGEIITHGRDGFLVKKRSPAEFAKFLFALCDDGALREKVALNAMGTVRDRFSSEKMAEQYSKTYRDLMQKSEKR